MERKREEFCNLSYGSMIVHQYRTEFNRLSHYAPEKISTDAKKQARFHKGLSPVLRHDLNLLELSTSRIWSIDHSELSMEMRSLKSLASLIVILLHLLVQVLRNVEFGSQ